VSSGAIDYHGALEPLREACRISPADILWVEDLLRAPPSCGTLLRKCAVAIRHLCFVPSVWRLKKDQHMLIREFSNVPLALVFLLIFPWREKLFFTVNHNLQWTVACPAEKEAFRSLGRMGCRFVFFERIPEEPLRRLGINLKKCFSIPHPVPETGRFRVRSGGIKKIGVIGQFRAEKGIDDLLQHLEALSLVYDITVGVPNGAEFKKHSKFASGTWFELKDTSRPDAYRNTLSECDVIVFNHPASSYEFRASGLIADAVAAHVPVVIRSLPVLEAQISRPVRIGESFDDLHGLEEALKKTDEKLRSGAYRFDEYIQARSAEALAEALNAIVGGQDG
jgi:glycosyltransferase involved in cell wall biosynthesis